MGLLHWNSMSMTDRAQGVLYGQVIGDSLGSLVEFASPDTIAADYPGGVRELADGGPFRLSAGQPTDNSEMALALARTLVTHGFDIDAITAAYRRWAESNPFDIGNTCADALLRGVMNPQSQANGALMRISPVGVFCAHDPDAARDYARQDARLTHINEVCQDLNAAYAYAIARAVGEGLGREAVLGLFDPDDVVEPDDYLTHMGWVRVAFPNALYQLATAPDFAEALVATITRGGDTDTNAAICGALFGAVVGASGIPKRWRDAVDRCRPGPGTLRPRPAEYWPTDLPGLADRLLAWR